MKFSLDVVFDKDADGLSSIINEEKYVQVMKVFCYSL